MDPSTTLVTFFLQTDPSAKSVKLIGSWDNFTVRYAMDRDPRRGRGHWKGCHAFQNISCESAAGVMSLTSQSAPRSGGLKMGHDYYYYYEVNGSTEIYDPAQPTTTACPYLPGQTVNSLYIPEERTLHSRSASTTNLVPELFRTMNPKDKYAPTRTAAQLEAGTITQRLHTATSVLSRSSPDRSPSPPSWRRFFSRREESRGRSASKPASVHNSLYTLEEDEPPAARSEGTRTRDISPESLRRFLCDDAIPSRPSSRFEVRFSMINMDDDVNDAVEDEEDDDNFASVASPTTPAFTFATRLSPPPTHRSNNSFTTVTAKTPRVTTSLPRLDTAIVAQETPFSSPEIPSFDDSGDDSHDEDSSAVKENMPFAYKLPVTFGKLGNATSPKLVGKTADVDDLSELGWMVGAISIGN